MVMDTLQIRLTSGLMDKVDSYVKRGLYSNRSDAIRDAVRRLSLELEVGSIKYRSDSVKLVKDARKHISRQRADIKEINSL